jgi:hypothetical protein
MTTTSSPHTKKRQVDLVLESSLEKEKGKMFKEGLNHESSKLSMKYYSENQDQPNVK